MKNEKFRKLCFLKFLNLEKLFDFFWKTIDQSKKQVSLLN